MENRDALLVHLSATQATGIAERDAAVEMLRAQRVAAACTIATDKNYDTHGSDAVARALRVTRTLSENVARPSGSAIGRRERLAPS